MVAFNEIQAQLMGIDKRSRTLNIQEVKQLASVLKTHEQIMACLKGWYKGSVSVLCATDQRVIILDRGSMEKPINIVEYCDVIRLQHSTRGWICGFAVVLKDQKHEFKVWGMKRSKDLHSFMHRHILYLKKIADESALSTEVPKVIKHTGYTSKNWRSLMRKMGNAATS